MRILTNVTLLIPRKKIYCDFSINLTESKRGRSVEDFEGFWEEITWKVTPDRSDYSRRSLFPDNKGDAFMQRNTNAFMQPNIPGEGGAQIFMFNFGHLDKTLGVPPGTEEPVTGYAQIVVDVRQNAFPAMGKESWAKEAVLIPQMESIFGIFWG